MKTEKCYRCKGKIYKVLKLSKVGVCKKCWEDADAWIGNKAQKRSAALPNKGEVK